MKYCIKCTKNASQNTLTISGVWTIENIAFIANETQKKLICSPFTKDNVVVTAGVNTTVISVPDNVCNIEEEDLITFMIDDFKSSQDIINDVNENLGSMNVGDMTIRGLLEAIKTDALTLQQLTDVKDAITALIGAATDSASASTIFGKIAAAKEVIDLFAYGYAITQNDDGTETYTLDLDNSASIDDSTLNIA